MTTGSVPSLLPPAISADAVDGSIAGQRIALEALDEIRAGVALPDSLHSMLMRSWELHGMPGHRAACRAIQKALERGHDGPTW